MIRVKICGLMNQDDVSLCVHAGVHTVGFVVDFPQPVPWNLTMAKASRLINKVPPFVCTCAVTGGSVKKVLALAETVHPDIIQLHYQETLAEVKELAGQLNLLGIKTIKALRIGKDGKCAFEIDDPAAAARALAKTKISALLVDSFTSSLPGGTGVMVDLAAFDSIRRETSLPVILAGGLNPQNITQVIQNTTPYAVDVLTGVEETPGRKSREKVYRLMQGVYALGNFKEEFTGKENKDAITG